MKVKLERIEDKDTDPSITIISFDIQLLPETKEDKQLLASWESDGCHTEIFEGKNKEWHIVI